MSNDKETVEMPLKEGESGTTDNNHNNNDNNNNADNAGDTIDAKLGSMSLSKVTRPGTPELSVAPDAVDYHMSHRFRGKCLIVNNRIFERYTRLNERNGTEKDRDALVSMWRSFNFDVEVLDDATSSEIKQKLRQIQEQDFSTSDCLVICVLTHGDRGVLWSKDCRYNVDDLYQPFTSDNCPSLAGKPKLFFIQACQGSGFDRGTMIKCSQIDAVDSPQYYKIPTWADFLIMYSTIPGYYSWRNPHEGSWFIQALTATLQKHAHNMDLLSMLTIVNQKVAYNFESFCPGQGDFDGNKQVPCITSMLTRRLFLGSNIV